MSHPRLRAADFMTELVSAFGPAKAGIDAATRRAYSVDASIYRVDPEAVLVAENETDVVRALAFCREQGSSHREDGRDEPDRGRPRPGSGPRSLPDGAAPFRGQGTAGGARRARPRLRGLERDLEPLGLMFAPDPSSGDVCRIGGMIANNSAGPRTVKYEGREGQRFLPPGGPPRRDDDRGPVLCPGRAGIPAPSRGEIRCEDGVPRPFGTTLP